MYLSKQMNKIFEKFEIFNSLIQTMIMLMFTVKYF